MIPTGFRVCVPGEGMEQIEHSVMFLELSIPCLIQVSTTTLWNLMFLPSFYSCGIESSENLHHSSGVVESGF